MHKEINILSVPHDKITGDVLKKVDAMLWSIYADNIRAVEEDIEEKLEIGHRTQRRYKCELRRMFGLPSHASLRPLEKHPQLRQALESLIVRDERSDKDSLRSAKNLSVIVPNTGEVISVEGFLKSLYPREGVNATS